MTNWMGVVTRDHVLRAVSLGIAQVNHGKLPPLRRMRPGDGLVYYSSKTTFPDGAPLKAFTAIGRIVDEEPWQADEVSFQPWRRKVDWADAHEAPIAPLMGQLDFTRHPNWGYALRLGLLQLSDADFSLIRAEMGA